MIFKLVNLITLFFITSINLYSMDVGFNQAWFKTNFGSQWTNPQFDQKEVGRVLDLAQNAGAKTLRVWLFEGIDPSSLIWKDGKVSGLHPDFLKNFEYVLREAKKRGIKLYPTLFTPERLQDAKDQNMKNRWWNLYNDKFGGMDSFKQNALRPILDLINDKNFSDSIFGIDVANEIDSGVLFDKFENKWDGLNKFVCSLKSEINPIPVTASMGWGRDLSKLYIGAESEILKPNPKPECIDFWDLHVYRDSGEIKNCEELKKIADRFGKKLVLGEFGQDSKRFDDKLQKQNAESFLKNAEKCGFDTALAWRLSDVRPGLNKEARHTYEAFEVGRMRPAYEVIRNYNLKNSLCLNPKGCKAGIKSDQEFDNKVFDSKKPKSIDDQKSLEIKSDTVRK